jgi:hypothetical protein
VKKQFYAITLLLSFLIVLGHQVISHHHHDTLAYDFSVVPNEIDEHSHEHNNLHHHHDSYNESNKEKDSNKDHNHSFPLHQHIFAASDFDLIRTNVKESSTDKIIVKAVTVLCLFHKEYSEPSGLNNIAFSDPPFFINSLFEPGAFALRGPPSIV